MQESPSSLTALSSSELLAALDRLAARGRELTADLVALLAECDERKLYAEEGYASLFEFCVQRLRLSESQAYHRIQAARAARRFSLVLERLRDGRVTLTAVALLREHLTEANHVDVLDWAEGRRKREVEEFVRALDPKPDVPTSLRRLAPPRAAVARAAAAERAAPVLPDQAALLGREASETGLALETAVLATSASILDLPAVPTPAAAQYSARAPQGATDRRVEIRPLAPARYSLHVTISEETHDKLRRAQDLLRHAGAADAAVVLDRALTLLVAQLERQKAGAPRQQQKKQRVPSERLATGVTVDPEAARVKNVRPLAGTKSRLATRAAVDPTPARVTDAEPDAKPSGPKAAVRRSRYVPAAVRRAVWERDGARCAYVSPSGVRCGATAHLEFHHRVPFAEGGASSVDNLVVTCALHNQAEAARWFNFDQAEFVATRRGGA